MTDEVCGAAYRNYGRAHAQWFRSLRHARLLIARAGPAPKVTSFLSVAASRGSYEAMMHLAELRKIEEDFADTLEAQLPEEE